MQLQFITFFNMIIAGVIVTLVFHLYSFCAKKLKVSQSIINLLDVFYSLITFVVVFFFLYQSNKIEIRIFVYFGFFFGIYCYRKLLRNFFNNFFILLASISNKVSQKINQLGG